MKIIFFGKVKLFWMVFRRKRLERTHRRDKLFLTQLIKSVYQLLLTRMRHFTLKSSILGISSRNPLLDDNVRFLYKCVFLPNPNTMIINYYHLSWGNFKNIAENLISICEQFGLWMYNSLFYEMPLLWSILTIHTIDTRPKTQMPKIPRTYSKET